MKLFEDMQTPANPIWDKATLVAARVCILLSLFCAVSGALLDNAAPAWIFSMLETLGVAGFSFGIVLYIILFVMSLSSSRHLAVMLMIAGGPLLLASFPILGAGVLKLISLVMGLFLISGGLALAGSLILSSSVLIHDSKQTRSKL